MSGLLPSLSCFLDDFNSCAASIASCFKVKSLSTFMDTVTIYFFVLHRVIALPCGQVWVSFPISFWVLPQNRWSVFFVFELFLFLFFHSLVFARSALFYKSLLYFNCFICYSSVYCCFRRVGEKCVVVVVPRKCKCPYRHRFKWRYHK